MKIYSDINLLLQCKTIKQRIEKLKKIHDLDIREEIQELLKICDKKEIEKHIEIINQAKTIKQKKKLLFKAPDYLQEAIFKQVFLSLQGESKNDSKERRIANVA